MIKGILALFKSGVIFDPFVLLGIVMGSITMLTSNKEAMEALYKQNSFYLFILLLAFLYNFLIKKVYKNDGVSFDWLKMGWNIVASFVKFIVSCVFSILFFLMLLSF